MIERVRQQVQQYVRENDRHDVDSRRFFCLDDSKGPVRGCLLLFFGASDSLPRLVAKGAPKDRARMREGRSTYEIDLTNLTTLEEVGMNAEASLTPSPLALWDDGDVVITLQSALAGRLLKNVPGPKLFSADRVGRTFDGVVAWWRTFQRCFGVERRRVSEEIYLEEVVRTIERFRQRFVTDEQENAFLDRRFRDERRLLGVDLPFMAAHGDFCAANVMENGGSIAVFDWEFPLRRQLPLFDLFYFVSSTRFPFRGLRGESTHMHSFQTTFWGDSYYSRAARSVVLRVCREYEIDAESMEDLFLLSLIQTANLKFGALEEVYGIDEGRDDLKSQWQRFGADKDVPFACIREGVSENLRYVVRHGLPGWFSEAPPRT